MVSRRLRIKLIAIPWELDVATLSLSSLAAVTPAQFDIAIVDLLREKLFLDEPVDLVGITASTPTIDLAYTLADVYRSKGVKVVIGGHHATSMPQEALEHADAVVRGEGEGSWIRICEEMLLNPSKVSGIYSEPAPDLAELPQPRIDLMKIQRYSPYFFPIIATRGCPERCSFCISKEISPQYRTYPIAHVLEQIRRRPNWRRPFYFVDDNLPGDLEYARELFRALSRYRIPFGMQARWEFSQNPDDLELARAAGCIFISSGYESVNQTTLNNTSKRARSDDYRRGIQHLFDAGILSSGNWVFGFDWDTPDVFRETLNFLDHSPLLHSTFTTEIPFPGTATYRHYAAEGRILTQDYSQYLGKYHVVVRPKLMTPERLSNGVKHCALEYFSAQRLLKRYRMAIRNPRFTDPSQGGLGVATLAMFSLLQYFQWRMQMMPTYEWIYRRVISVNKDRYLTDRFRQSNFFGQSYRQADDVDPSASYPGKSWLYSRSGCKVSHHSVMSEYFPQAAGELPHQG